VPTIMTMEWPGLNKDQYDRVMSILDFDHTPPIGGLFHAAGFTPRGLRVFDIWNSQRDFERFQKDRLAPTLQKVGLTGQPIVEFVEAYNVYAPGIDVMKKLGASSLAHAG
jgi:hypothetical protein